MTRKQVYEPPSIEVYELESVCLLQDLSYHQAEFGDLVEQDEWGLQP